MVKNISEISKNTPIRKKPSCVFSFKGLPIIDLDETFIFDMEDEIADICKTFSVQNKKQEYNLIDTLKQACRKIIREKTGKKPFTRINLARI